MINQERSPLIIALANLLKSCGRAVDVAAIPTVESVPEPLVTADSPEQWVAGLALHAGDLTCACEQLVSLIEEFSHSVKRGELQPADVEIIDSIWDITTAELSYHASAFPSYAGIVREAILRGQWRQNVGVLVPIREGHRPRSIVPVRRLVQILVGPQGLNEEDALWVATALSRLYTTCKAATAVTHRLASEPEAAADVLIERFAELHLIFLDLTSVLLEADVAAVLLFRQLSVAQDSVVQESAMD